MPTQDTSDQGSQAVEAEDVQVARYRFMQKLCDEGIFREVTPPRADHKIPSIWIAPRFYSLDLKEKERFVSVVWCYYNEQDPEVDFIALKDVKTGRRVGSFSRRGIELKD